MHSLLNRTLILLTVIGLILTPPVLSGYIDIHRAEAASQGGEYLQAAKEYELAGRLLPWRDDLWEQAGTAHFLAGNLEKSIVYLEWAQKHNSLSASGWNLLGQAYWRLDDKKTAESIWQTGLKKYPDTILLFAPMLSVVYREQDNFVAERDMIERWLAAGGSPDESVHYRLGLLLVESDPERALQELMLASSMNPSYDPAVQTLRTALNLASLETDEANRLVIVGRGLGLVNEWKLAEPVFQQAVAADGKNAEAWAWLGEAEQHLGQDGRAEMDKALSLGSKDPIVHSLRGLYWMRQGRDNQALAEYLLAAEYDPKNPAWQVSIGEAYTRRGDLQAAYRAYSRATEMAPRNPVYWRLLATFSAQYNFQVEEIGLPAAQKAIDLTPDDPQTLDTLGLVYLILERYDEAAYQFKSALTIDPQFAPAHLHLGIVDAQKGDWQAARDNWQQAVDLDEGGAAGQRAQVLLNQYFP